MKTTSKLIYNTSKIVKNKKIEVTIRLDEDSKNGYEYFSSTCSGYYKHRGVWREDFCGCAHDEILKFFPEFKIFTDVHLWSFGGYDVHAVANGFYFVKNGFDKCSLENSNFPEYFCDYFNCNLTQFNTLKNSEDIFEFSVLLIELGVVEGWKSKVKKAISNLEKLTGKKFKSNYEIDKNEIKIDPDKLKRFRTLKEQGYYSEESKKRRVKERLLNLNKAMVSKVRADYNNSILKHAKALDIKLELIKQGFEISPRTGNIKGAIYHSHSNELNFNWSTEKIEESVILGFANSLDPVRFEGLKISNDKKHLLTV